jgi:hypothetical protein
MPAPVGDGAFEERHIAQFGPSPELRNGPRLRLERQNASTRKQSSKADCRAAVMRADFDDGRPAGQKALELGERLTVSIRAPQGLDEVRHDSHPYRNQGLRSNR